MRKSSRISTSSDEAIRDFTFDDASKRVDDFLDIQNKHDEHLRPDLYHQQRQASPYHPGGHHYTPKPEMEDPRNRGFIIPDRRPEEYREPAYDPLRRNPINNELPQIPTQGGQPGEYNPRLIPPEAAPAQENSSRSNSPATSPTTAMQTPRPIPKAPQAAATIQPVAYEHPAHTPKVVDEKAGRTHTPAPVIKPQPPTTKKKTWGSNLTSPFSK